MMALFNEPAFNKVAKRICDPEVAAPRIRQQFEIYAQIFRFRFDFPQGPTAFINLSASDFFFELPASL